MTTGRGVTVTSKTTTDTIRHGTGTRDEARDGARDGARRERREKLRGREIVPSEAA